MSLYIRRYCFNKKETVKIIPDCLYFLCNFNFMDWRKYIVADKEILNGKPSIKGTRLSVEFILERLADGWTEQMLYENHPTLSKEGLQAVYAFALENLNDAVLVDWEKH